MRPTRGFNEDRDLRETRGAKREAGPSRARTRGPQQGPARLHAARAREAALQSARQAWDGPRLQCTGDQHLKHKKCLEYDKHLGYDKHLRCGKHLKHLNEHDKHLRRRLERGKHLNLKRSLALSVALSVACPATLRHAFPSPARSRPRDLAATLSRCEPFRLQKSPARPERCQAG